MKKRSKNARLPLLPGTPLLGPGGIPSEWTEVRGFGESPNSHAEWLVRKHGESEIDREGLGLSAKDQTSPCETWIHLSHGITPIVVREREVTGARGGLAMAYAVVEATCRQSPVVAVLFPV